MDIEAFINIHILAKILPYFGSYSEWHEDYTLDKLMGFKDKGFYLDIGANDPINGNNTKRFYDKGWHGINIEPIPELHKNLVEARPRDTNLNIGVGSNPGVMTFYKVIGQSKLSSLDKEYIEKLKQTHGVKVEEIPVYIFRFEDIYNKYVKDMFVDFLTVDAESGDLDILKSNDWNKYRPKYILVETDKGYNNEIKEYLISLQYKEVYSNSINSIFKDVKI